MPSHVAGLQLRRRLATEHGAFAAVRFETLPRLAELLGAAGLAAAGKSPLARPIGDYLAAQVALGARDDLAAVRNLPGFGRVLRQTFRRLRRGGFVRPQDVPVALDTGLLGEIVRLYGIYRARSSDFYDDEDLLEAAAESVDSRRAEVALELGDVYVIPPGARSAGSERLLASIRRAVGRGHFHDLDSNFEERAQTTIKQSSDRDTPEARFVLAPDPASEVREVARVVIDALRDGLALHEVGVFHGADPAYRPLLAQAFASAGVPINALPGVPLSETAAGRGVLMLAGLPLQNYSRTQVLDWLSLAPLRDELPASEGKVLALPAPWRREAREAGITQGIERWRSGLNARIADLEARLAEAEDETYRARYDDQRRRAVDLRSLVEGLVARMEPLRQAQPASTFIERFKDLVAGYMDPSSAAFTAVEAQIDQLGTIDKVGGSFSLESFTGALRANLEAAHHREGTLGDGVLVSEYRVAGGLSFKQTVLCGAYEGVFPAGAPAEPLVEDRIWQDLRRTHPMIEDAARRLEHAQEDARQAIATATHRLTWTAPLQASGAGREHYPAQLMVNAARSLDARIESATALRRAATREWLHKPSSPTAALLTGTPVDLMEVRVRASIAARREGRPLDDAHPLTPSLGLLAARRADRFGEFDGNLGELAGDTLIPRGSVSPTSLETYATCGFKYFLGHVLRLRPPDEPEDRETMDAAERGTVVHAVLQEFFQRKLAEGRPAPGERWNELDHAELLVILEDHMDNARDRGKTGLDVYAEHERRRLRADMRNFLDQDSDFRIETGAVPVAFEQPLPEDPNAAVLMRGYVDRIDWTPDRRAAWVIDYKTGGTSSYEGMKAEDPLAGGTKLQLPAYLAAVHDAQRVTPLYWFISTAGNFKRIEFAASAENMARYRETLEAIVAGVRGGVFPAVSGEENTFYGRWENCRFCDFHRLCSRRRDDELLAKLDDPSLRPWTNVGKTARRQPE